MRKPALLLAPLLAAAAISSGCPGNNPTLPPLYQGGWSWNPAVGGDRPFPVTWSESSAAPQALPLLQDGCSGSVQGIAMKAGQPLPVGISVTCTGDSPPQPEHMVPVIWNGTTPTALPLRQGLNPPETQGVAMAVGVVTFPSTTGPATTDVYVGGATGDLSPVPAIWKNGILTTVPVRNLLTADFDAGVIHAIAATDRFVVASGLVHVAGGSPTAFEAMIWVFDPDLLAVDATPLLGFGDVTPGVATFLDADQTLWSAAGVSLNGEAGIPAYWENDVPHTLGGSDFISGPFGIPTDITVVGITPYATGYATEQQLRIAPRPTPVIWAGDIRAGLSTVAPGPGIGAGETIGVINSWALVAGETVGVDPTSPSRLLSVPAFWNNGTRRDLQPLVAPGTGPVTPVALPFFGWWQVPPADPLNPPAVNPYWPYPGGSAAVFQAAPITAAGSAVVRAMTADLPPP